MSLSQLERAEYKLVDALAGLPARHQLRARVEAMLGKVRATKASWLDHHPDVLRKASRVPSPPAPSWRGLPIDGIAAKTMAAEARSRSAEEQRLAKASGRTRYQAPEHLRGSSMRLVDGRRIDVPDHGFVTVTGAGVDPGYGPQAMSAAHRQLLDAGFRVMPDDPDDALGRENADTLKAALRRPIVGDRGLIAFLNRNAVR
jgi:hypothetical protein